jgi:hypothetical protein
MSDDAALGLLHEAGYRTVEGFNTVRAAIASESDGSTEQLCSGYRVFPDGSKCGGCRDCRPNNGGVG